MLLFKIAFRNILRNGRRSLMTGAAIAVGAIALILFGEYIGYMVRGMETGTVRAGGHLSVFKAGYFEFGNGNPAGYSISGYKKVMGVIKNDPVLKPMLTVVTPKVSVFGIAGNFAADTSKTFMGTGVVPADLREMRKWDDYHTFGAPGDIGLKDGDDSHGYIGKGLARMLMLCEPLKVDGCPKPKKSEEKAAAPAAVDASPSVDLAELAARDRAPSAPTANAASQPRIDLLAATATGSPNVVSLTVTEARYQSPREFDDMYVGMTIGLAQQLLYGRGEHKAVAIAIQLRRTADVAKAKARLESMFRARKLDLEVHDFRELNPEYNQVIGLFSAIFVFIAVIMGIIVLFTVVNTMTMTVMERINEIGTIRAMGVRRSGVRRQFLLEGSLLGVLGATAGVVLSTVIAVWFNSLGATWIPPGESSPIPLRLLTTGVAWLQFAVWLGLVLMATVAAYVPARRAAGMKVVDALRHV
jgi:putative ABC transport system permease protein